MTAGSPRIRRAEARDAAALTRVAASLFIQSYAASIDAATIGEHVAAHFEEAIQRAELNDPGTVTLLVEHGPDVVGFAQVRRATAPGGSDCAADVELWRIYVDRSWHGTGLARQLLGAAVDAARSMGGTGVWLSVWDQNPKAIAFYRKHGFRQVGQQPYTVGSEVQSDLVMCARLEALEAVRDDSHRRS